MSPPPPLDASEMARQNPSYPPHRPPGGSELGPMGRLRSAAGLWRQSSLGVHPYADGTVQKFGELN
jgi:hypothetical protein